MITMSFSSGVLATVAAAAVGATGAGWMLYGAIIENRILVARIQRWERRTARTPLWTSRLSGYHTTGFYGLHTPEPRPRVLDGNVVLAIPAAVEPPARLAITSVVADDDDAIDSIVDDRVVELALRRNQAEVRRALRCTERLLMQSRRHHVARHRIQPVQPRTRRPQPVIGSPRFPWEVNQPAPVVARAA